MQFGCCCGGGPDLIRDQTASPGERHGRATGAWRRFGAVAGLRRAGFVSRSRDCIQ